MSPQIVKAILLLAVVIAAPASAQPKVQIKNMAAPDQSGAILLYPDDSSVADKPAEQWARLQVAIGSNRIDNLIVRTVVQPTITPYLPNPATATGAAVIVAPGGAFMSLSMTSEGSDVARWLADHGVAAFVLKYRLNETSRDNQTFLRDMGERFAASAQPGAVRTIKEPRATQDALRALAMVRDRAAAYGIDSNRIGMIGFSAGAMTTLNVTLEAQNGQGPAFIGYIYGPMTQVAVPADAPPMFSAIAMDDGLFKRQGFTIVEAWRKADRPVELHAYERGDHGFGTGKPGTTTMGLMPQFLTWMEARGLLTARR